MTLSKGLKRGNGGILIHEEKRAGSDFTFLESPHLSWKEEKKHHSTGKKERKKGEAAFKTCQRLLLFRFLLGGSHGWCETFGGGEKRRREKNCCCGCGFRSHPSSSLFRLEKLQKRRCEKGEGEKGVEIKYLLQGKQLGGGMRRFFFLGRRGGVCDSF